MKIVYKDDTLSKQGSRDMDILNGMSEKELCQLKQKYFTKALSGAEVYLVKINDHEYISKQYKKKDKRMYKEFHTEIKRYLLVRKNSENNHLYQTFFIQFHIAFECQNYCNIFMSKLNADLDSAFLQSIASDEKINLLKQAMIVIYEMNHYCSIFFNDIYHIEDVRNCMILFNDNKRNFEYRFNDDYTLIVPIDKYLLKIIDYGRINSSPNPRPFNYMRQHFNNLFERGVVSETILFTYLYLKCCGIPLQYVNNMINVIVSFILKKMGIEVATTSDWNEIDYLFIRYLLDYIKMRDIFH